MAFQRAELAANLRRLAEKGVYFGTSSWKYPGWLGEVYEKDRYIWRGKFSKARFERDCLAEYARTFPAVSVDASYYQFFQQHTLEELAAQVPDGFQFGFKVCDEITVKRFPRLPRFGDRAGTPNPNFLNAELFADAVITRSQTIRQKVGLFMFEFSHFGVSEFSRGAEFVEALDGFLEKLPRGWPYGIELRNRQWLQPEYFSLLAKHGVTHIYNAWSDMPPVPEQMQLTGSETNPSLLAARFLLREGRYYEAAVKKFSPYERVSDPNPEGRAAAVELALGVLRSRTHRKAMIYVNNRFEGNSPSTIEAMVSELQGRLTD